MKSGTLATTDADERTTEVGLYHYARSYRAAGEALAEANFQAKATHPDAPREFMYIHAIELYLKAFLRNSGMTLAQVTGKGHNFAKLRDAYISHDGFLMDEDESVLELLTRANVMGARYISTGYFTKPTMGALSRTAKSLHETTRDAIRAKGKQCAG